VSNESENEKRITAELDVQSLLGLVDPREGKPTTVMRRDELLPLVDAITPIAPSEHVVPRAWLERREKIGSREALAPAQQTDIDSLSGSSRVVVLVLFGLFVGLFVAILASAH
jgi:hypothetical protein